MMISGAGSSIYTMGRMSGMGKPPDPSEKFAEADTDGSGGLDQTEFQALADKISRATGEEVDIEALFATYDEDEDGVLSKEEAMAALEANRPEGPPPQDRISSRSGGVSQALMAKIENYARMGAQSDMTAMFGGNGQSFASEMLLSIDTLA